MLLSSFQQICVYVCVESVEVTKLNELYKKLSGQKVELEFYFILNYCDNESVNAACSWDSYQHWQNLHLVGSL